MRKAALITDTSSGLTEAAVLKESPTRDTEPTRCGIPSELPGGGPSEKPCVACGELIRSRATRCPHCREYQGRPRRLAHRSFHLATLASAVTAASALWAIWGSFGATDSDLRCRVARVEVRPTRVEAAGDIDDAAPCGIFAVVAVCNPGRGSGTIEGIGIRDAKNRCDARVTDLDGERRAFPMKVAAGDVELLLVEIGTVRTAAARTLRDESAARALVEGAAGCEATFEPRSVGQGGQFAGSADITLGTPHFELYSHLGEPEPTPVTVEADMVVGGLLEYRDLLERRLD